jgi:hypothetical protein
VRDWEEDLNDNDNSEEVVLEEGLDEPGKTEKRGAPMTRHLYCHKEDM